MNIIAKTIWLSQKFSNLKDCTIEIINELAHQFQLFFERNRRDLLQDFICPHNIRMY
jgi:hypothetical protein